MSSRDQVGDGEWQDSICLLCFLQSIWVGIALLHPPSQGKNKKVEFAQYAPLPSRLSTAGALIHLRGCPLACGALAGGQRIALVGFQMRRVGLSTCIHRNLCFTMRGDAGNRASADGGGGGARAARTKQVGKLGASKGGLARSPCGKAAKKPKTDTGAQAEQRAKGAMPMGRTATGPTAAGHAAGNGTDTVVGNRIEQQKNRQALNTAEENIKLARKLQNMQKT